MSFKRTYAEALESHKEMRRSPMVNKGSGLKRKSEMKRSRIKPEDKVWRDHVLERDGYRCRWIDPVTDQRCREVGAHIQAHHINERSQRPDLVHDVTNGAAICPFHHDYAHHDPNGRKEAEAQGMLGGETYEKAMKREVQP